jgi:hypothetical protein
VLGCALVTSPASAAPPPPLNCNGNVNGHVSASYTGTALASTNSDFDATMVCKRGTHPEPMTSLEETALVYLNGAVTHTGPVSQCASTAGHPCSSVESKGTYVCSTGAPCAGDYRMAHRAVMVLPAGQEWGPPSAGCSKVSARKLQCLWVTGAVHVQAVLS